MPLLTGSTSLLVSIDVDLAIAGEDRQARRALGEAAGSLASRLDHAGASGTWGVADPVGLDFLGALDSAAHEVAILGERHWTGPCARSRFQSELATRRLRLEAIGGSASSLLLADGPLGIAAELLAKAGFSAIRPPLVRQPGSWGQRLASIFNSRKSRRVGVAAALPRALHWGLWELAPSLDVLEAGARRTANKIDVSIDAGEPLHVVLPLRSLALGTSTRWGIVERVLKHVRRRRDEGLLETSTMSQFVARLALLCQGRPSQSILRKAA